MSPCYLKTMEVKWNFKHFNNQATKGCFKRRDNTECLVVSSHVPTLKHKVKQQLLTQKWLFQLLQDTNKEPFPAY